MEFNSKFSILVTLNNTIFKSHIQSSDFDYYDNNNIHTNFKDVEDDVKLLKVLSDIRKIVDENATLFIKNKLSTLEMEYEGCKISKLKLEILNRIYSGSVKVSTMSKGLDIDDVINCIEKLKDDGFIILVKINEISYKLTDKGSYAIYKNT